MKLLKYALGVSLLLASATSLAEQFFGRPFPTDCPCISAVASELSGLSCVSSMDLYRNYSSTTHIAILQVNSLQGENCFSLTVEDDPVPSQACHVYSGTMSTETICAMDDFVRINLTDFQMRACEVLVRQLQEDLEAHYCD